MKKLSRLLLVLGLALCISLTAYAEDAPAAQPTAKEPRTLTARTGTETSLWNAYAFLAQQRICLSRGIIVYITCISTASAV